jgi:O-antigen/teichoic acid export membrane protein
MLNSDESVSEKLVNKGFWIYLFVILTSPISYAIRIVLSHDLSLSDFGLFYGIISFMSLLSTYSDFGMTESLNYFIPKFIVHNDYGRSKVLFLLAFGSQIVMSLVIGGTIFSLSPWLAENYFHDPHALIPLQIMCLFFIGLNMMHIGTAFFTISQNTKYGKGIEFFRMLLTLVGIFFISFL